MCLACARAHQLPTGPKKAQPVGPKPQQIISAPAGTLAITTPAVNATMWVLAGNSSVKTLTRFDAISGKIQLRIPASPQAVDVVQTATGTLILGLRTASTGAIEVVNPATGRVPVSIPVAAPVLNMAASNNGTLLYVLEGTPKAHGIAVLNIGAAKFIKDIPVSNRSVAIAPLSSGTDWVLLHQGTVDEVSLTNNQTLVTFATGGGPASSIAASPDGLSLYVLRPVVQVSTVPGNWSNVAAVKVATEQVTHVLPAPAHCVDITISTGGQLLYTAVGTQAFGNVQVYALKGWVVTAPTGRWWWTATGLVLIVWALEIFPNVSEVSAAAIAVVLLVAIGLGTIVVSPPAKQER